MIRLERAMQVLRAEMREGTSPKSTAFKRKHEDLRGAISKVEQHLSFEDDVDPAYSDYLEGRLDTAEHLLDQVDDTIDQVQERLEEKKRQQGRIPAARMGAFKNNEEDKLIRPGRAHSSRCPRLVPRFH